MGLRNSLLPIERGLEQVVVVGFSKCRLLPWITSLRLAMDLEQPDRQVDLLVDNVALAISFLLELGSWTSEVSVLQWRDFLSENQTLGSCFLFF